MQKRLSGLCKHRHGCEHEQQIPERYDGARTSQGSMLLVQRMPKRLGTKMLGSSRLQ